MKFRIPGEVDTLELSEKGVAFPILSLASGLPLELNGKALTITAKGADSEAYQKARLEIERKRARVISGGGDFSDLDARCELLAAVTTAWSGFEDSEGREAQCTPANAAELYKAAPAIRDQVDARVHNRANFIKASSPS